MKSRKQAIFAALMSSIIAVNSFGVSAFADDEGEETSPVVECEHTLNHTEAKTATCKEDGNKEYWTCTTEDGCGKVFSDKDAKNETTVADMKIAKETVAHTITAVQAKPASCTEAGYEEHYKCSVCEALFSDAEGKPQSLNLRQFLQPVIHTTPRNGPTMQTTTGMQQLAGIQPRRRTLQHTLLVR